MLKKSQRLGKRDIENFFKNRFKSYRLRGIVLRVSKNESKIPRFAFIVSSSIKRNAVARNLTRRRMAEITQELSPKINNNLDMVFSFKLSGKKSPSFISLKNDIIELLSLCGIL